MVLVLTVWMGLFAAAIQWRIDQNKKGKAWKVDRWLLWSVRRKLRVDD
jgi:hypothetical protein